MRILGGLITGAILLSPGCLPPTQVTLLLTTDASCADIHGVDIMVGPEGDGGGDGLASRPPVASTTKCEGGRIGTLVLVPSSGTEMGARVAVQVVAGFGVGKTVDQCKAPSYGKGCIVARRRIGFVKHSPLVLPITLSASCDGIPCEPSYTCVQGRCVPDDVPPSCATGGNCDPPPLALADCGDTSGLEPNAVWPMTGMCATHIARSPYAIASSPKFRWRLPMPFGSTLNSLPAVGATGKIYFGTPMGALQSLDAKSGAMLGTIALPGNTNAGGNPGITANGNVSISASSNLVHVSGDLKSIPWTKAFSATADVAIGPGGSTWTVDSPVTLLGFDANGNPLVNLRISNNGGMGPRRSPAIGADGTVYVSGGDASLSAVDPRNNGSVLWTHVVGVCGTNASDQCTTFPVVAKDKVLVNAYLSLQPIARTLLAFDPKTGMNLPAWNKPGLSSCAPVVGPDGTIYATVGNQLTAYDGTSAAMLWATDVGSAPLECLMDGSGAVVVLTGSSVVAVDTKTKAIRWSVGSMGGTNFSLGSDGTVYLLTTNDIVALGY